MKRPDVLLLANAIMGQFLSGFASRIFIVSLPTIAGALDADIIAISWALIAYQLAGISLSVVFGRLGDVHGRYAIYGLGFAVMAASSLLCGLAPNALAAHLFRLVQGSGAAMIASADARAGDGGDAGGLGGTGERLHDDGVSLGPPVGPPVGGLVIDLVELALDLLPAGSDGVIGVVLTVLGARAGRAGARGAGAHRLRWAPALLIALTSC